MLLGNAHVKSPFGHGLHHKFQRTARRHGRGNTHYFFVLLGQLNNRVTKNILIQRRLWSGRHHLHNFACLLIEYTRRMPLGGVAFFGRRIALAFNRDAVQNLRPRNILQVAQHLYKVIYVVSVNGTEVPPLQ